MFISFLIVLWTKWISDENSEEPSEAISKRENTTEITNIALASISHHIRIRDFAEIATLSWIDGSHIS